MTERNHSAFSSIVRPFKFALVAVLCTGLLASCLVPEQFVAEIEVKRDGTYTMTFDGTMNFLLARAEWAEKGKLSEEIKLELEELEKEILEDHHFTKAVYIGEARYDVSYRRGGILTETVYFTDKQSKYITIYPEKNGIVRIEGFELSEKDYKKLEPLKLNFDGVIKVKTDGVVLEHNAKSTPKLFGLLDTYTWQIKSPRDPLAHIKISLKK